MFLIKDQGFVCVCVYLCSREASSESVSVWQCALVKSITERMYVCVSLFHLMFRTHGMNRCAKQ